METKKTESLQDKKLNEMVENINKLKQDVKDMRDSIDDMKEGQKEIDKLLKLIENQ